MQSDVDDIIQSHLQKVREAMHTVIDQLLYASRLQPIPTLPNDQVSKSESKSSQFRAKGDRPIRVVMRKGFAVGTFPKNPQPGQTFEVEGVAYVFVKTGAGQGRWQKAKEDVGGSKTGPTSQKESKTVSPQKETSQESDRARDLSEQERKRIDQEFARANFKEVQTSLVMKDGQTVKLQGQGIAGLVVHPETLPDGSTAFGISHHQSGLRVVGGIATEENAKKTAYRLAQLLDWERSQDKLEQDPNFADTGKFALQLRLNPYARPPSQFARQGASKPNEAA